MQNSNLKYKYKFSVIMSIYNVEEYLEEAIESIIKQDIGFEENIQLILINDGSPDNSKIICEKYKKMYPNNIIYVKKKNGGLSSAKNCGLNYIEGEFVNFFDADDTLPNNTFLEVYNFFKRNYLCIDFVTIPLYFFGAETGLHAKYKYMGSKNRIINLAVEPYNFILSGAASFYKNEIFDDFRFDETFVGGEDTQLNCLLYLKNNQFGYVCENGVIYNYRKRFTKNSIVDTSKINTESYKTVIRLLDSVIPKNNIQTYHKELIIYEIRSRLKNINKDLFETEDEYNDLLQKYIEKLKLINTEHFIKHSKFTGNLQSIKFFLSLIESDETNDSKFQHFLDNVTIRDCYISNNLLTIDLTFNNYGYNNIDVVAFDENNNIYSPNENKNFEGPFDLNYGEFSVDISHMRRFVFDIRKIKIISFIFVDKNANKYYPIKKIIISNKKGINSIGNEIYYKKYKLIFTGRKFKIRKINGKNSRLHSIKNNINSIRNIYKNNKYLPLLRLFSCKNKKYILINDRADKAGDNGEALFKYINDNDKELSKKTYFVISKKSEDYKRLKKIGKVLKLGSIKHKLLFINSQYIYSSHTMPEFYNAFKVDKLKYYKDQFTYKFVWLQHGITQNDISKAANRYLKGIDYVITSTLSEKEEFSKEKYCYDNDQVLITGFSRYDYLVDQPSNIITIAPTWRRGLGKSEGINENIEQSDFYKRYSNVLKNKTLIKECEKKKITIKFLLHPEMLQYENYFKKFENSVVKVYNQNEIDYNNIFKISKLLITDYSSILFDFAYLKKPEIYFQFDQDYFFKNHYKKGYFDYKKDAFGDVVIDEDALISKIIYYINNDFKMENKYINRVNKTFRYSDKNNSKRIIEQTYYKATKRF